jgi:hypothetical protein
MTRCLALVFAAVALTAGYGCGRRPTLSNGEEITSGARSDPWDEAAKRLRKETDQAGCKTTLAALNHDLSAAEKAEKPSGLAPEAENALAAIVPLNAQDRDEIRGAGFTAHDSVYLAECFYLRDAARSIAIPGLSPERLADHGFAWVCRQVYLNPWLIDTGNRISAAALSPPYVLRRGNGTALERMYVFLALMQQLEIDACLIGPPDAGAVERQNALSPEGKPFLPGGPARPFWAVGIRVEKDKQADIKLYDPWRASAFPATLSQLKSMPEAHQAWFADAANLSGVKAEDVKAATVYLAAPVNALAPRMVILEKKLAPTADVKLAVDPSALRARFPDPKPNFWNPLEDRFAYGRAARTFLPVDQGGADRTEDTFQRLYDHYIRLQIPSEQAFIPVELQRNKDVAGDIKVRITERAREAYGGVFLNPPTPRERIQRGKYQDATTALIERRDLFRKLRESVRLTPDAAKQISDWVAKATELYFTLRPTDPASRDALNLHWRSPGADLLLNRAMAEVGLAESSYLLALCRHEQAERAQARLDHAPPNEAARLKTAAAEAWLEAFREWSGYREQYAETHASFWSKPEDTEHLKVLKTHINALIERARRMAHP